MSATLTIELPNELLDRLQRESAKAGKTPEALAIECLDAALAKEPGFAIRRWAGAWASGMTDASLRHDELIGEALYEELGEEQDRGSIR